MAYADFLKKWETLFGFLSRSSANVLSASGWARRQSTNSFSWTALIDSLCCKEPKVIDENLKFLPRLLLLPIHLQRSLAAFVYYNRSQISDSSLSKLSEAIVTNPSKDTDQWLLFLGQKLNLTTTTSHGEYLTFNPDNSSLSLTDICDRVNETNASSRQDSPSPREHFSWLQDYFQAQATNSKPEKITESTSQGGTTDKLEADKSSAKRISSDLAASPDSDKELVQVKRQKTSSQEVGGFNAGDIGKKDSPLESITQRESSPTIDDREHQATPLVKSVENENKNELELSDKIKVQASTLKEILQEQESGNSTADISMDILSIFTTCTDLEMPVLCEYIGIDGLAGGGLKAATHSICSLSPQISYTHSTIFTKYCFLSKVLSLSQAAARPLSGALAEFGGTYPRQTVEAVLVPVLVSPTLGAPQVNLLTRIVQHNWDSKMVPLIVREFERHRMEVCWSEHLSSFFHSLISKKHDWGHDLQWLSLFVSVLELHGRSQQKSLKFAKLLVDLITNYGNQLKKEDVLVLKCIIQVNETLLKKTAIAGLKRLSV